MDMDLADDEKKVSTSSKKAISSAGKKFIHDIQTILPVHLTDILDINVKMRIRS
jgi:hypothetical protein